MLAIVDANCAQDTMVCPPHADFAPIWDRLFGGQLVLAYGGTKLRKEYQRLSEVWRVVIALDRAGRARAFSDAAVDACQNDLISSKKLTSDDPHVIALARVSGARLLCSRDQALHTDFLSKSLIDKPRGKVYQSKKHVDLLPQGKKLGNTKRRQRKAHS